MGLFTPKMSKLQMEQVNSSIKQAKDCATLINKTVKPDVFFGRLNFLIDTLTYLQDFEKYNCFKSSSPTRDMKRLMDNLEATVNDFLDRSFADACQKVETLKTEKAKQSRREKYVDSINSAFECANTFWGGNMMYPHYTGCLYTEGNVQHFKSLIKSNEWTIDNE